MNIRDQRQQRCCDQGKSKSDGAMDKGRKEGYERDDCQRFITESRQDFIFSLF